MKITYALLALVALAASCQESLEEKCEREARTYTQKKCPAPVNKNTIIDSMTFDRQTHTLRYHYTLRGPADNEAIGQSNLAYDMLLRELKNATFVKDYKDAGYNFRYTYRSQKDSSKVLYDVTFTKDDYR